MSAISKSKNLFNNKNAEYSYVNHKHEFFRFFESHKNLCDVLSGFKKHGDQQEIIDKYSFREALKKLNGFIVDYIIYVENTIKIKQIWDSFKKLEGKFLADGEYNRLCNNKKNISKEQSLLLEKKYLSYLVECFEISYMLSKYLQSSLNISSNEIIKNLQFVSYDAFFNNLSSYRDEMSTILSNLNFVNLLFDFKKLLGYYFTYKYLVGVKQRILIDNLIKKMYLYLVDEETIKLLAKASVKGWSVDFRKLISENFIVLRDCFNSVYFLCNHSLSMKNILPKNKVDILIDRTTI